MRRKIWIVICLLIIIVINLAIVGCSKKDKLEFEIRDLLISPVEARIGENITITFFIKNVGDIMGTKTVILNVDGIEFDRQDITLGSGEAKTTSFTMVRDIPGIYSIDVEGLTGIAKFLNRGVEIFVNFNLLLYLDSVYTTAQ